MGKWLLKMGIMVAVGLGLTYVEGKMLNRLLWAVPKKEDEPTNGKNQKVVLNQEDYKVE